MTCRTFLIFYFLIVITIVKSLVYITVSDTTAVLIASVVAIVFSFINVADLTYIIKAIALYYALFALSWVTDIGIINAHQVDSILIAGGSAVLFVIPMGVGIIARKVWERVATRESK